MVVIQLKGGLGNQMFQYAVALHLSIKFSQPILFDLQEYKNHKDRNYQLDVFGIEPKEIDSAAIEHFYKHSNKIKKLLGFPTQSLYYEKRFSFEEGIFKTSPPVYVKGFFQSYKYFTAIEKDIRSAFNFKLTLDEKNQEVAAKIKASNSISIHVRRGDYLVYMKLDNSHITCDMEYYNKAITTIKNQVPDCTFYIFTDDPEWVKENFIEDYVLVEGNIGTNSWKDMYLMSLCKHNIIANSTFSWWSAWLNASSDKIVIAPQKWFGNKVNEQTKDLYPPGWIII